MDKRYLISYILSSKLKNIDICKIILSMIYPYKQNFNECILQIPREIKLKKLYIYYDRLDEKFVYLDRMIKDNIWLPLGWECEWLLRDFQDEYYEILSKTKFNANFCSYKNKTLTDKYQ